MKSSIILLLICWCVVNCSYAQKTQGPVLLGDTSRMVYYQDAIDVFGDKVFPGTNINMQDSFMTVYQGLTRKLGMNLSDSGVKTDESLRIWWNVYFDKTGKIDGIVFHLFNTNLSDTVAEKIYEGARELVRKEKIPISSIYSFRQCGSFKVTL